MASVQSIIPPVHQGLYIAHPTGPVTGHYPITGRGTAGGTSTTEANALWNTIGNGGLDAGTFEVVIEWVQIPTGSTNVVMVEKHADGAALIFSAAGHFDNLNVPMRDGFVMTTGGGCMVAFRIHKYQS